MLIARPALSFFFSMFHRPGFFISRAVVERGVFASFPQHKLAHMLPVARFTSASRANVFRGATSVASRSRRSCGPPKRFPVATSEGFHPFPSRTRKLSPPEPMVLHGFRVGE